MTADLPKMREEMTEMHALVKEIVGALQAGPPAPPATPEAPAAEAPAAVTPEERQLDELAATLAAQSAGANGKVTHAPPTEISLR